MKLFSFSFDVKIWNFTIPYKNEVQSDGGGAKVSDYLLITGTAEGKKSEEVEIFHLMRKREKLI